MYKGLQSKIYQKLYSNNEGLPSGYRESQERVIYNLFKRIEKYIGLEISEIHDSQIIELARAYFSNTYKKNGITFKEIMDELTKKKFNDKNLCKGYTLVLKEIQNETFKNRKVSSNKINSINEGISLIYMQSLIGLSNYMNDIIDTAWKNYDDNQLFSIINFMENKLKEYQENIIKMITIVNKTFTDEMLIERLIFNFMLEDLKRKIVQMVEIDKLNFGVFLGNQKYKIPDNEDFTLKEIAEIICKNNKDRFTKEYNSLRKLYPKMPLSLRYSSKSKKNKSYEGDKIPKKYVMNLLAEREITKLDKKIKSYRNDKVSGHNNKILKNEESTLKLPLEFVDLATSINARETNKAKLNFFIKTVRIKTYKNLIKILK